MEKKYAIQGIIGCILFGIGDWLLGFVDPKAVEGDVSPINYDTRTCTMKSTTDTRCILVSGFQHYFKMFLALEFPILFYKI